MIFDYSLLGTSNKRSEKNSDHNELQKLMDREWPEISQFSKRDYDQIKEYQLAKVKRLVKHAFETVPLYNAKYSAVGFHPLDLRTWEDFEKLPLLTKEELIDAFPDKFISSQHSFEFTTRSSGSSGRFVTLAISPEAIYRDTILGVRQFQNQSNGRYNKTDLALFIYTSPWWVSSIDGDYPTKFVSTETKPKDALEFIHKFHPKILSLYPTYLARLQECSAPLQELGVGLVVVHSEQSSIQQRIEWSNYFGIPVLDEYSSEELTRIALECPYRKYHLEEDSCYVEFLDLPDIHHSMKRSTKLVVGTNLLNEATPIIRYVQGDLASLDNLVDCECGSNFRTIKGIEGRIMDSIRTSDGEIIPAGCFLDLAYNWYLELDVPTHGLRYQIVQQTINSMDIYLVPSYFILSSSQLSRIKNSLYNLVPKDMVVNVHVVKEVPFTKTSKYKPVISKNNGWVIP